MHLLFFYIKNPPFEYNLIIWPKVTYPNPPSVNFQFEPFLTKPTCVCPEIADLCTSLSNGDAVYTTHLGENTTLTSIREAVFTVQIFPVHVDSTSFPSPLSVNPVCSRPLSLGGLKASQPKPDGPASSQQQHPEQDCFVHEPMSQMNMSQKGSQVDIPGKMTLHDIDWKVNDIQTWLTLLQCLTPPLLLILTHSPWTCWGVQLWEVKEELPNRN